MVVVAVAVAVGAVLLLLPWGCCRGGQGVVVSPPSLPTPLWQAPGWHAGGSLLGPVMVAVVVVVLTQFLHPFLQTWSWGEM